jgi:signal transduction histidine kinase
MKKMIRNLIIGKEVFIESRNEYRQVMLSGHLALLSLIVIVFYIILELPFGFDQTIIIYAIALFVIVGSIMLHRNRFYAKANLILFFTYNLLLFLLVSSENRNTGVFMFFIPASLGAFAVFNYAQRKIATAFTFFSFILFILAMVGNFSILTYRNYTDSYIQLNQLINFCIAFPVSVMAVYLLISLNHENAMQLMESNKQLGKLNEELDRFVYSTSHDLRSPLLSVMGLLKLAETSHEEKEIKMYHGMMHQRLASLDKFIKDITDYSRNNRLQIVHEDIHLASLSTEIWDSLKYSADAQDIEFVNDLPSELIVSNDGSRLRVVLSNLISNAIRYHDNRKEKKYIRVYHRQTPSSFSLHIEDNGQGIAPEHQTKIFQMFFRAHESSQGSGLGLYIVKETLVKLSCSIQLTSIPMQGSTFSIYMPY